MEKALHAAIYWISDNWILRKKNRKTFIHSMINSLVYQKEMGNKKVGLKSTKFVKDPKLTP